MKNKSVMDHNFGAVPVSKYPRSVFNRSYGHKLTCDADYLVPLYGPEHILPGDTLSVRFHILTRLLSSTIKPLMDNIKGSVYTFFCPYRLLWANFKKHMGEQDNPSDSISFNIPYTTTPTGAAGGVPIGHLYDYMGVPTEASGMGGAGVLGQRLANFPGRFYNKVWHDHFRDQNLQVAPVIDVGDGPDTFADYNLLKVNKRFDYFTSCLPNPQKGGTAISLPIGTSAPLMNNGQPIELRSVTSLGHSKLEGVGGAKTIQFHDNMDAQYLDWHESGLQADLSSASGATINGLRQAITLQQFLERDAVSGTRYQEIVKSHFAGVIIPDFRAQRSEIIHIFNFDIKINPVAQTSTPAGGSTNLGDLAGFGTGVASGDHFVHSFNEHGVLMSLVTFRADITYSQGLDRFWSKSTRYDHFWPVLAHLGEQAVYNKELYWNLPDGNGAAQKDGVFGYIPRYDEFRHAKSRMSALMRPGVTGNLGVWHLSELFSAQPTLGPTFIGSNTPLDRCVTVPSEPHFMVDAFFDVKHARIMPVFAVPGLNRL